MDCAVCYNSTVGLKTVKCSKPCEMVYCSWCWSEMDDRHKSHCMYCKRKFPTTLSFKEKRQIYILSTLIVAFIGVLIKLYPYVPFETVGRDCDMNCNCQGFYCNTIPELCEAMKCSKDCFNIKTLECHDEQLHCREFHYDNITKFYFAGCASCVALIVIMLSNVHNLVKYKEAEPV